LVIIPFVFIVLVVSCKSIKSIHRRMSLLRGRIRILVPRVIRGRLSEAFGWMVLSYLHSVPFSPSMRAAVAVVVKYRSQNIAYFP
jgi:hypothetical protein